MLTEKEVTQKLREYADRFNWHVMNREWGKAHNIYLIARNVAVFVQMPDSVIEELFGEYSEDQDEKNPEDGLFRRADVSRVDLESCIRRNMAYEDMACRRIGQPERYYSEDTYCASCKKTKK